MTPKWELYAQGVEDGSIIAGGHIRNAVRRYRLWQERKDIEFRAEQVERVISFFGILHHFKDAAVGKAFLLEPWQEFLIACIYGWCYPGTDTRVVNNAYIEVARKNGKTAFAAGLCMYHLVADGVAGAEVDLVANSREQASIAFDFASHYAKQLNTERKQYFRTLRKEIFFDDTSSKLNVFASDASRLDGFNASMYLYDEYHAAKDTKLRDVLQSSQANRQNPLEVIITTAGFDKGGPCYSYRETVLEVMRGSLQDDTLWGFVYSMDDGDEWEDERNWVKCNPNMGVSVNPRFLRTQARKASTDSSSEVGIRTKTFNQWMDSAATWIPSRYTDAATSGKLSISEVYDAYSDVLFGGVDLSATRDLTAFATMLAKGDHYYFWIRYYLPAETVETSPLRERYKAWQRSGHLQVTPGNVVDYDYILADIKATAEGRQYFWIGYDKWNATQFVINATQEGLPMRPYSQNIGSFNAPTKALERLIMQGNVTFDDNPITRFCFANVQLRQDFNGNQKPDKSKADNKIDGIIAALEALGVYLESGKG